MCMVDFISIAKLPAVQLLRELVELVDTIRKQPVSNRARYHQETTSFQNHQERARTSTFTPGRPMVFVTWHMDRPLPGPGPYAHE